MSKGLTHSLIESHRVAGAADPFDAVGGGDREVAVRIDHVLIDGPDGSLVLRAFEAAGGGRIATELALACAEPGALCGIESAQEQIYLERASRRCRAIFSRSGNGAGPQVYCSRFAAPAYPLEEVQDPTGAGDSFAGGFMGYLANTGNLDEPSIRQAIVVGSVMASFNVEEFSLRRLSSLTYPEIEERYRAFKRMTHFEDL